MSSIAYADAPFDFIQSNLSSHFVLLVTATATETKHLHGQLTAIQKDLIYKIHKGSLTYFIGKLGLYNIIHVQCGMGTSSRDASIVTIKDAINDLKPKVIVMVGIAFGTNKKEQQIGDVLVSEVILPYEFKRVGEKYDIQRSGHAYASQILVNRFKSNFDWEYNLPNGKKADLKVGDILSGDKLIDNKSFRDNLVKSFPTAKGGEMEGAGLFSAANSKAEWILIKGICDFADGRKSTNKKENQAIAIEAAISASMILFNSPYAFDGIGIEVAQNDKKKNQLKLVTLKIFYLIYIV
ncbi:hypothetical protein BN8_02452 [Fibrisoma limi BUZ 3]|uniref:Nucleoside phosphorylase domain-containing protein n=1 Tax=Fibrisoma limi BUZ 3 TaxID=1185876 RepID=I2GHI5_9BACT|nr:hypothetical protein [Fibrisoma limi]CCH53360.1 hypothetical protein BN8_02452 [Fibrisoma limi BUZ 3]